MEKEMYGNQRRVMEEAGLGHWVLGARASVKILEELAISPGRYCEDEAQRADSVRVLEAKYKEQGVNKPQRRLLLAKERTDKQQEKEGDTYVPGGF
ncbi:hypothetical protein AWC38_SpisGene730 [Stylophora pistillata]|uniref:Uncharacterized protein n=1 Tax=Stylophora pistillata TaxID=50429 RepID=A0A2B4SUS4_STYPI|nr:hypothetical protein AWC38_SpisGene730 [Stylophora pistillata]